MEDNKEIVRWLSLVNTDSSNCSTVSNMTMEKQQTVDTQSVLRSEYPNLNQLRNAMEETIVENNVLNKEISELLNKLQINAQTSPVDIKEGLKNTSAVLRAEGLSNVDETALVVLMERKKMRNIKQKGIKRELKAKYKELIHRHCILEKKLNYLMENVGTIKSSIEEKEADYKNEYSSYKLSTSKLVEYNGTASTIETNINSLNLKELMPEKVLEKHRKLIERKGKLAEINRALKPYKNLTPNVAQAKAMLEDKEMEYKKLSQKFLSMTY